MLSLFSSSSSSLLSFISTCSVLSLLLLFFSHLDPSFTEAANQCAPVAFRNGSKVSFFDIPNVNFPQLAQIGIGGGSFQFSYKPCDPDAHVPNAPKQCQGSFLSQTGCNVVFTEMEKPVIIFNEYVDIKYRSTSNGLNWTANLQLHCNLHVRDTIICPNNQYDATQTGGHTGPIFLTFQFESRAFCTDDSRGGLPNPPPPPPGGEEGFLGFKVTWGVVFLVIFFVPLFLYLLIMIPINCADSNKSGAREICPHFEVWSSLPGLALDGVTFLWSKLRGSHWQSCEDGSSSNNYGGGGYTGREIVANNYGAAI